MILFKKREKNVNVEIGKEEKMTETERKMAELGAAAYFEYLEMCFEDEEGAGILTGYIYTLKAIRNMSDHALPPAKLIWRSCCTPALHYPPYQQSKRSIS